MKQLPDDVHYRSYPPPSHAAGRSDASSVVAAAQEDDSDDDAFEAVLRGALQPITIS